MTTEKLINAIKIFNNFLSEYIGEDIYSCMLHFFIQFCETDVIIKSYINGKEIARYKEPFESEKIDYIFIWPEENIIILHNGNVEHEVIFPSKSFMSNNDLQEKIMKIIDKILTGDP